MASSEYRDKLLNQLTEIIENLGANDKDYDDTQKSLDILDVLELLLGYTIHTTCNSIDTIRDSSEESYFNIKRRALTFYRNETSKNPANSGASNGSVPKPSATRQSLQSSGKLNHDRLKFENQNGGRS